MDIFKERNCANTDNDDFQSRDLPGRFPGAQLYCCAYAFTGRRAYRERPERYVPARDKTDECRLVFRSE
jgi:hypothetical protein